MKSTVRPEVPPDNCLHDKRLDCPGALTEHIISQLLNTFPQVQVDNVAIANGAAHAKLVGTL